MADNIKEYALSNVLAPFAEAQRAMANRPQKSSVVTDTFSTSTPYALEDLITARDSLGTATRNLDEALKAREGLGYTLASALSAIPEQQGYGSWLSNLGRSFGAGLGDRTNAQIDRAQKVYDAQMKDLATRLAYDKAMGETSIQRQNQNIGYKNIPGTGKGGGTDGGDGIAQYTDLPDIKLDELNKSAGSWATNRYDSSDKEQGWLTRQGTALMRGRDYGLDKSNKTKQANKYEKFETVAMKGMYDVLKVLRPATDTDVLTALKSAGADPTMTPDTRDLRLTGVLNGELRKAGLPGVKNLQHWDKTVEYAKKYGVWNPDAAQQNSNNTRSSNAAQQNTNNTGRYVVKNRCE